MQNTYRIIDGVFMTAKESAQHTINQLPDHATWSDIIYELFVKQKIEAGISAVEDGRTIAHDQVKTRLRQITLGR